MRRVAIAASIMTILATGASAQPATTEDPREVPPPGAADEVAAPGVAPDPVVEDALERLQSAHATVIEAAKIARARTRDPRIVGYADRLLRDHRYAERRVADLADERNVAVSPLLRRTEADGTLLRRLQRFEGAAFDRAFLASMERLHARTLSRVQGMRARLRRDPELEALLGRTAPILQQHRDLAESLQHETRGADRSTQREAEREGIEGIEGIE